MNRWICSLVVALLAMHQNVSHCSTVEAAELSESDFKLDGPIGSNNSVITRVGKNHFKMTLGDQPGIPHQAAFVYFIIKGNAKGNLLRLDVEPSVNKEGKRPNSSWREYFHSWSYDGINWTPIHWKGNSFFLPEFKQDVVYFGNQVPMSYENLVAMIKEWKKSPFTTVKVIGKSAEGRNLYRVVITDPNSPHAAKHRWGHYFATQHGGEGNAQWRVVGMIEWALSKAAKDFRQRSICHFVVMMSPDSPSHGWMRGNSEGQDMNRSYVPKGANSELQTTEPYAWQKDFEQLMASESPVTDIWSCHTWGGKVEILYTPGPEVGTQVGPLGEFRKAFARLDTTGLILRTARKEGGDRRKWTLGPHDQFGITSFLCEGSGGIFTKKENMKSGAIIIEALGKYYVGTRRKK